MLSRNSPIAFIVGVTGFIGSHLAEKLLSKGVQVIGVDNLSSSQRENMEEASKNKNFHFLDQDASLNLHLDLPRLDYAIFTISEDLPEYIYCTCWENFLKFCQKENFKPKIILISSIDLYDSQKDGLGNLKYAEKSLANFAMENKYNARVVRLAAVFGPRMHFRLSDPILRLIQAAAWQKLQKENTPLDFTSRSIYIADATELLLKALMHGATAQKIYDGALFNPLKVSEIKEVLLDPMWYESKGFTPTQLPPWPTPNLLKTEKELAWKPKTNIVIALKETIHFFKENPQRMEEEEREVKIPERKVEMGETKEEKKEVEKKAEIKKREIKPKKNWGGVFLLLIILVLAAYALFYPAFKMALVSWEIKNYLTSSYLAVEAGELDKAKEEAQKAKERVNKIKKAFEPLMAVTDGGIFGPKINDLNKKASMFLANIEAFSFWVEGMQNLMEAAEVISGAKEGNLSKALAEANFNLDQAEKRFKDSVNLEVVRENKKAALLLSQLVPAQGERSYLVLLIDNFTLRGGGGVIKAYGELNFKEGKLASFEVKNIADLEKTAGNLEFPADLKKDFAASGLSLKDINFEADFPTNAKLIQWIYNRSQGGKTAGVIALDFTALSKLLEAEGGVLVGDKKEMVTGQNLNSLLLVKKDTNFETAVFKELLQKIFFLVNQNWTSLGRNLGESLSEKHLLIYAADPLLFSYLNANDWSGVLPRQTQEEKGVRREFLAWSETNIGSERANAFVQRTANLQSTISPEGKIFHKLEINFKNLSPNLDYSSRFKIYLPQGTRLLQPEASSFSDYGRSGYSLLFSLKALEKKSLKLEFEDAKPLDLSLKEIKYLLEVIKQPGTGEDKFDFTLRYPASFKVVSKTGELGEQTIPQEIYFPTTLARDQKFEVVLGK